MLDQLTLDDAGQVGVTSGVSMSCAAAIILLGVILSCPSRPNRHGGLSLATITGSHLQPLHPKVEHTRLKHACFVDCPLTRRCSLVQLELCPVDMNHNIVTNSMAFVDAATGAAVYLASYAGASGPVLDIYGGQHTSIAYDDTMCLKKPFNPSQPVHLEIFVAVISVMCCINRASIRAIDVLMKASILFHIIGPLVIIIGLPIAARGVSR